MLTTQSRYDDVLYGSWPFAQSHPDRLVTLATVYGMDPPPNGSGQFRLLELGCACGDNLIPLAMQHPQAEFVGLDLSGRQIQMAQETAGRLGVNNVRFECLDLMQMPERGERFDFITAHGVYSWIPPAIRDRLLAICHDYLLPNGIAYISYDVYPGCKTKDIVCDALRYHVGHLPTARDQVQQGLEFLKFMAEQVPNADPVYDQLYKRRLKAIGDEGHTETLLLHDLLVPEHQAVYFHQFAEHAARHKLQFLAEADIAEMQSVRFPEPVVHVLQQLEHDWIRREQYLDFFKLRPFRQSLLCHQDVTIRRQLTPDRLEGLRLASEMECETPQGNLHSHQPFQFRDPRGVEATIDHPLTKASLLELRAKWPHSLTFAELEVAGRRRLWTQDTIVERQTDFDAEHAALAEHLLGLYTAGLIEAHAFQPPFTTEISQRPVAHPWCRLQAERGRRVTNAWHTGIALSDVNRELLLLLDGTRDREQLINDLSQRIEETQLVVVHQGQAVRSPQEVRKYLVNIIDTALNTAASLALLIQ